MSVESESHNMFLSNMPTEVDRVQLLMRELYPDLKRLALSHLSHEQAGHTLSPTAVVNETYLKLYSIKQLDWIDKPHFLSLCSQLMRRILVDYARSRHADKRGGHDVKITLYEENIPKTQQDISVENIHQAIEKLGREHPDLEKLVELRYFGGFTNKEVSQYFEISLATVKRKWVFARALLYQEMME